MNRRLHLKQARKHNWFSLSETPRGVDFLQTQPFPATPIRERVSQKLFSQENPAEFWFARDRLLMKLDYGTVALTEYFLSHIQFERFIFASDLGDRNLARRSRSDKLQLRTQFQKPCSLRIKGSQIWIVCARSSQRQIQIAKVCVL